MKSECWNFLFCSGFILWLQLSTSSPWVFPDRTLLGVRVPSVGAGGKTRGEVHLVVEKKACLIPYIYIFIYIDVYPFFLFITTAGVKRQAVKYTTSPVTLVSVQGLLAHKCPYSILWVSQIQIPRPSKNVQVSKRHTMLLKCVTLTHNNTTDLFLSGLQCVH